MKSRIPLISFVAVVAGVLQPFVSPAQCTLDVQATVVEHSVCAASGVVDVVVTGGPDVDMSYITINLSNGAGVNRNVSAGTYRFTDLPGSVYTVIATGYCTSPVYQTVKDTAVVAIQSNYIGFTILEYSIRNSLNCRPTGAINLRLINGIPPYTVTLLSSPAGYSGTTTWSSSATEFAMDSLAPGNYTFQIKDSCGYQRTVSYLVPAVGSDYPFDPYSNSVRSLCAGTGDCNEILLSRNYREPSYYWNDHPDEYYEVSFTVNGITIDWMAISDATTLTLPYNYKEMRDNGYAIDVHLRIKGCSGERRNIDQIVLTPYLSIDPRVDSANCDGYHISFQPSGYELLCFPYEWEMRDTDRDSVVGEGTDIRDCSRQVVRNLKYNRNYSLLLNDSLGSRWYDSLFYNITNPRPEYSYSINYCPPDTFNAYYFFYIGWPLNVMPFPVGTRIRQTDGPMTVPQPDVTLTTVLQTYYPFSSNPRYYEGYRPVPPGSYSFEITMCDSTHLITFEHGDYEAEPFTYKAVEDCDGLHVFPLGRLLRNGQPIQTYYSMIDAPDGVSHTMISGSSVDTVARTGYFRLPVSGHYAFQRTYSGNCGIDTVEIDYTRPIFGFSKAEAYACAVGTMPRFDVKAQNGFPPYTYTLYENGVPVASNNTGDFVYGDANRTYSMRITDSCGTVFPLNIMVLDLGNTNQAVSGSDTVCMGETIYLNCVGLGATEFLWTGPDGFSSTSQFATVPNATTANSGTYTLTFQPPSCGSPITQSLEVLVYVPPPPTGPDTLNYCQNDMLSLPGVEVLDNHTLVWFAADSVTECQPPSHDVVYEATFYIAQRHNTRGCIGEKRKVTVKVNALPPPPSADTVQLCRNGSNTLPAIDADAGHTLLWYDIDGTTALPLPPLVSTAFAHETTYYIAQRNNRLGCESDKSPLVIKVNETPTIAADTMELCRNGANTLPEVVPDAGHTLQWYDTDGTTALAAPPAVSTAVVREETYYIAQRDNRLGCESDKTPVVIRINELPPPVPVDTIRFCRNSTPTLPEILPIANHTLIWYDTDGITPLAAPPTVSTAAVHEETYYIAQRNNRLGCESEKEEVVIAVIPLPSSEIEAPAEQICPNTSPVIDILNTIAGYTYEIYADAQATTLLHSVTGTGGDVSAALTVTIAENTVFYIKVIGTECTAESLKAVTVSVKSITFLPSALPLYYFNQPYWVQFTTNTSGATYSYSGTLPAGLTLTPSGQLSGTVPYTDDIADRYITVSLIDEEGCVAEKPYVLMTCAAKPNLPQSNIAYCERDEATPLQASSPNGSPLYWYDSGQNRLSAPPVPSTLQAGEQRYYVSQYNDDRHCEGPLDTIVVTVHSLPLLTFEATADDICFQTTPTIALSQLREEYTYRIYSDPALSHPVASVTGVTGSAVALTEALESNQSYYLTVTSPYGCVSATAKEVGVNVIIVDILPEKLPSYRKNEIYSVQISSDSESPVFTLFEGALPSGLSLGLSGRLSGLVPLHESGYTATFTVQAEDINGCIGRRRYVLPWDYFAPRVFTPNGDGINEVFMIGHKLVIFDRLGIIIYEGENGWDGTYKNRPAPPDIYFYKIWVEIEPGREEVKTGYIGLERER
jgi:gliding motility-associated-like protein